jgi:hypothetical protein
MRKGPLESLTNSISILVDTEEFRMEVSEWVWIEYVHGCLVLNILEK